MAHIVAVGEKQLVVDPLTPHLNMALFISVSPHKRWFREPGFEIAADGDTLRDDASIVQLQNREFAQGVDFEKLVRPCICAGLKVNPGNVDPLFSNEYANPLGVSRIGVVELHECRPASVWITQPYL